MKLHQLSPAYGSTAEPKRKGRGTGSGNGKTGGRGHKGQNARSGGGVRPGFEGGQMPLARRLPKRGFKNIFGTKYAIINVSDLDMFEDGATVTVKELTESGLIKKTYDGIKLLANGEIKKKVNVTVSAASAAAKAKVEAAGGKVEVM